MSSHHQRQLKEMTALHINGPNKPREESPPTAPPTLSYYAGDVPSIGRTHSIHSAHPPTQHDNHSQHREVETTPFERNSPSSPHINSHTQSEQSSINVREKSPLPDDPLSVQSSSEEDGNKLPHSEGSQTPLTAGTRSGSLTDVSTCSKGGSAILLLSCTEKLSPSELQQMKTESDALCQLNGDEQHGSDLESSSECSSSGKSPPPLEEEGAESVVLRKSEMPTLATHTSSAVSHVPSHLNTDSTTVSMPPPPAPLAVSMPLPPAPLVKTTTVATTTAVTITTTTPSPPHLSPTTTHHSTLQHEIARPPPTVHQFTPLEHLPSKTESSGASLQPPARAVKLPNFFMTPQQLEESMRSLRASALSRAPPRAGLDIPQPKTASPQRVQCHRESVAAHLKTLQEVRAYLESRRTTERPHTREVSASETQRLARIFSS